MYLLFFYFILIFFLHLFVETTLLRQAEWCCGDICSLLCNVMYNISLKALLSKPPISHNKHLYVLLRSRHLRGWGGMIAYRYGFCQ